MVASTFLKKCAFAACFTQPKVCILGIFGHEKHAVKGEKVFARKTSASKTFLRQSTRQRPKLRKGVFAVWVFAACSSAKKGILGVLAGTRSLAPGPLRRCAREKSTKNSAFLSTIFRTFFVRARFRRHVPSENRACKKVRNFSQNFL